MRDEHGDTEECSQNDSKRTDWESMLAARGQGNPFLGRERRGEKKFQRRTLWNAKTGRACVKSSGRGRRSSNRQAREEKRQSREKDTKDRPAMRSPENE